MVKKLNEAGSKLTYKAGCELLIVQELVNNPKNGKIGREDLFPQVQTDGTLSFEFSQGDMTIVQPIGGYIGMNPTKLEVAWLSGIDLSLIHISEPTRPY